MMTCYFNRGKEKGDNMLELTSTTRTDATGNTVFDVVIRTSDGREKRRSLFLDDYITLLSESKKTKDNYAVIPEGFLPADTIEACVASTSQYDVIWRVHGEKRLMLYGPAGQEPKAHTVPFPDLIFRLSVDDGIIRTKECYAAKKGDQHLYIYPFGNVATNGGICMGNIYVDELDKRVDSFTDCFFLGITNNDYWSVTDRVNIKGCDWSQAKLIEELEKRDVFPYEWLVPSPGQTLEFLKHKQKVSCGMA